MAFLTSVACAVLTLITIHAVYVLRHRCKRRKLSSGSSHPPLAPGPAGLPLAGNAFSFVGPFRRHNPHRVLAGLAGTYGPVVSFRPGTAGSFVVVSSSDAAREALVANDAALAARFVPDGARALAHSSESLFFLPSSSPLWKLHRATVGAHLSSGRSLDATRSIRDLHARRLAERLRARSGQLVAVGDAVLGAMLSVMSDVVFSRDAADMRVQGGQPFKDLMAAIIDDWTKPNVSDAFPFLAPLDLFGTRRRISERLAKLYKFFDEELIEPRLGSGESRNDLLGVVLARHAKSELTRSEITRFFTDIFLAASNTSRITVEWAMARLLKHPDKMEKVRAELAASLGPRDFVEESDLDKLPYLRAVVKETLRLHPPAPLLPRMVVDTDAGVSLGGFTVPANTCILVNLWAIGRDPAAWPEPEQFVPERFLGAQAALLCFRGAGFAAYRPFGAGRRVCPGLDLAGRLVPLLLASLLHRIGWRLPGGIAPEDVDLADRYSMVLELAKPLRAVPVAAA